MVSCNPKNTTIPSSISLGPPRHERSAEFHRPQKRAVSLGFGLAEPRDLLHSTTSRNQVPEIAHPERATSNPQSLESASVHRSHVLQLGGVLPFRKDFGVAQVDRWGSAALRHARGPLA